MEDNTIPVENGDLIKFRYAGKSHYGIVADRGRVVIVSPERLGTIILGNDCLDAEICASAYRVVEVLKELV